MAATEQHPQADVFVSVVAAFDSSSLETIESLRRIHEALRSRYSNFEIIAVDNGLSSATVKEVRALLDRLECIRVLRLSRRFSNDTAMFAGLDAAIGDFVVVVAPDVDPIEAIADVVDRLQAGADAVQGISDNPTGWGGPGAWGRRGFYAYNRQFLKVDIPERATYLTGLSRRAVNTLTNTSRNQRYLRQMIRHVGYAIDDYHYLPLKSTRRSRSLRSGTFEAIEMISSYSTHPLRMLTGVGVVAALVNVAYAMYVLVANLVVHDLAPGWTTTSLQLSSMFFIICIILAIQAEYLGRILTETRQEPGYFLMEEIESQKLIADLERRNVSD